MCARVGDHLGEQSCAGRDITGLARHVRVQHGILTTVLVGPIMCAMKVVKVHMCATRDTLAIRAPASAREVGRSCRREALARASARPLTSYLFDMVMEKYMEDLPKTRS